MLWHSGSDLSLPGLLHLRNHSTSNSTNEGMTNNCVVSGFGFVVCQLAVRVHTEPGQGGFVSRSSEVQVRRLSTLILLVPLSVSKKS